MGIQKGRLMIGWMLTTIYLAGTGTGILGVTAFHALRRKYTDHLQQHQRAIQELRAIEAHEEEPDQIEDDRITCPQCWEDRHPGQIWPMRSYVPCLEHTSERPSLAKEDQHSREGACITKGVPERSLKREERSSMFPS